MLASMNAGIRPVTLKSGVRALESADGGAEQLVKLAEERASIAAVDVVRIRGVPLTRALDMLAAAEKAGMLARDEHAGVTRFFPNRFDAFIAHPHKTQLYKSTAVRLLSGGHFGRLERFFGVLGKARKVGLDKPFMLRTTRDSELMMAAFLECALMTGFWNELGAFY
eukprot:IDg19213t1